MIQKQNDREMPNCPKSMSRNSRTCIGGYAPKTRCSITLFNFVLSLVLIAVSSPLLIAVSLIIKLKDGGPILYKGTRLGCGKRPYIMYKFRTLPLDSDKIIGSRLLTPGIIKIDYHSKILRDTRLDELPQLFNILKGDMDFIGPRPERPEIYEKQCRQIPNYDVRFLVKPGMIGYSQLFTPHSTSKRLRTLIDNRQILRSRSLIKDINTIIFTGYKMSWMVVTKTGSFIWMSLVESRILKKYKEKRLVERIRHERARVYIKDKESADTAHKYTGDITLFDINDFHFRMYSNQVIEDGTQHFLLETEIRKKKRVKLKRARCEGQVVKQFASDNPNYKYNYIVSYKPLTELNGHMIDRYFLKKSFA